MEDQYVTKDDLKAELHSLEDHLIEKMHGIETNLLKAFYGFAESVQQRLAQHDLHNDRMAIIERRLTDLEKRVNFPNAS